MNRFLYIASLLSLCAAPALAQDGAWAQSAMLDDANILWTCIAAFLVFFMQVGLAFLESGSTRAKNVCNIFMKNLMDVSAVSIVFWLFGFGIMFGLGRSNIRGSIWRMALSFWPYTALGSGAFQAPSGLARNAAQDVPQSIF